MEKKPRNKRTGTLILTKAGLAARVPVLVDGVRVKRWFNLGTDNRALARRKLARLIEDLERNEEPTPERVAAVETFAEAAARVVKRQRGEGLKTWKEREQRLRDFALPRIGSTPVDKIRVADVREVLEGARDAGKSRQTIVHIKNDLSAVLGDLWRDEVISENPVAKAEIPKGATTDERDRVLLADDEFARFMACGDVDPELHVMALASRSFGGMRTSDLHAWDWAHVDREAWRDAHVPRPKTKRHTGAKLRERLELPPVLVPVLRAWWDGVGRPSKGPVFPVRRGPNAGQRKRKSSYAKALREALWAAGIVRPRPGFPEAVERWASLRGAGASAAELEAAEASAKALCEIQSGSDETRPLDFHSFRRSFNTALAAAGVNVQMAMALAGHRSASTHMVYVKLAEGALQMPAAALPSLSADVLRARTVSVSTRRDSKTRSSMISGGRDRFRTCDIRLVRPALYR